MDSNEAYWAQGSGGSISSVVYGTFINYENIKLALSLAGDAFLYSHKWYVSLAMYHNAMWGNGATLSQSVKGTVIQAICNSEKFKDAIKTVLRNIKGSSVKNLKIPVNFNNEDLGYSIGKIDFYATGDLFYGQWRLYITGADKYNFDEVRMIANGVSKGNAVNDLGWAMQMVKMMTPFTWSVSFSYVLNYPIQAGDI